MLKLVGLYLVCLFCFVFFLIRNYILYLKKKNESLGFLIENRYVVVCVVRYVNDCV